MGRRKPKREQQKHRQLRAQAARQQTSSPDPMRELGAAWDRAVSSGLMENGTDVSYHMAPTGGVISTAIGAAAQLLVDGRELTPEWAEELRRSKPEFAGLVAGLQEKAAGWDRYERAPGQ
ncbi:hypothetical protein [Streptomyces cinereoruber]|uniref:hypothetical protein n=1 Tax=Streptomyces cinereoruber TaxID=67260 RepID=UPI003640AE6A